MTLSNLDNLVKTNKLKREPYDQKEFMGLVNSGRARLSDAKNTPLSPESRFDLAYNAAHALALAALRWHGYRPHGRYIVFQVLPFTLNVKPEIWRLLSKCHDCRNLAEYEGFHEVDEQLLTELLAAAQTLLDCVDKLSK